jgi:hypothetical protein
VVTGERNLRRPPTSHPRHDAPAAPSISSSRDYAPAPLDVSQRAQGVQIYIGGESGLSPLDECNVCAYEIDGRVIGTLASSDADGVRTRDPDRRRHREAPQKTYSADERLMAGDHQREADRSFHGGAGHHDAATM